jgi:hypothetical protein
MSDDLSIWFNNGNPMESTLRELTTYDVIRDACMFGRLDILKWWFEHRFESRYDISNAWCVALIYGHMDIVNWWHDREAELGIYIQYPCIGAVISMGKPEVLQWMIQHKDLFTDTYYSYPMRFYGYHTMDRSKYSMDYVALSNNVTMLQWALDNKKGNESLFDISAHSVVFAVINRSLQALEWIFTNYETLFKHKRGVFTDAFIVACQMGYIDIMNWFQTQCTIVINLSYVYSKCTLTNSVEVLHWLFERQGKTLIGLIGLDGSDGLDGEVTLKFEYDDYTILHAVTHNNYLILNWYHHKFWTKQLKKFHYQK